MLSNFDIYPQNKLRLATIHLLKFHIVYLRMILRRLTKTHCGHRTFSQCDRQLVNFVEDFLFDNKLQTVPDIPRWSQIGKLTDFRAFLGRDRVKKKRNIQDSHFIPMS